MKNYSLWAVILGLMLTFSAVCSAQVPITEYPTPTSGSQPFGIAAAPDGSLWFTEYRVNQIGKITTGGTISEYVIPTGGSFPYGITAAPDGNLWFTERTGQKIGRITTAGVITEFPVPGGNPLLIAAAPDGNLWFTTEFGNSIGRITAAGVITEFPIPGGSQPFGITTGPDGNLWFTNYTLNQIGRITPTGVVTSFSIPTGNSGPVFITAGPDGNLWFTEQDAGQIGKISIAGVITEFSIPTAASSPQGIVAGVDGDLWVSEFTGHQIARVNLGPIAQFLFDTPAAPGHDTAGGHNAIEVVGVTQVPGGVVGEAGSFVNGWMQLPTTTDLQLFSGDFTLSVFIKSSDLTNRNWFTNSNQSEHHYGLGSLGPNYPQPLGAGLTFEGNPAAGYAFSTSPVFDGNWHHVVGIKRANNAEIWIDGQLEDGRPLNLIFATPIPSDDGSFAIGRDGPCCEYFNGQMDEAKIWNRALDPQEIATEAAKRPANPDPGRNLVALNPANLWIGLINSDDQGTRFDLRASIYKNDILVTTGLLRCINGVTRNPNSALNALVPFDSFPATQFQAGDVLTIKVSTRIGTNPNDTKCAGHNNAAGLRLYFDSTPRKSAFGAQLAQDPMKDFYFHKAGVNSFLDTIAPTATTAKTIDSGSVNFAGGNPWKDVGAWSITNP